MTDRLLDLSGQVAVVTGGAGSIGLATAQLLAEKGADIWLFDIDADATEQAARDLGGGALIADITNERAAEAAFAAVLAKAGRLDILVNNAGRAIRGASTELPVGDWDKVIALNMTATFLCARIAARHMIEGKISGRIVNMASIMGLSGGGLYPNISYQASKGAVVNITRALAVEWAPFGIRVNAVAPTWVDTPFIAPLLADPDLLEAMHRVTPLKRIATPSDVASAVLFLASAASDMVTGHTLPVDGGYLAQ